MIKQEILDLARKLGIEQCGFSEQSFVALFPYYVNGEHGNISMYARGIDYHTVAVQRLRPIADKIRELGSTAEIHVDKGSLNDRQAAYQAGLGFFGLNGMLICEAYGSYFFIGQVTHNLEIERDHPLDMECMKCGACIRHCIGNALGADGFNVERCVSHISQKRGVLTAVEEALIVKSGLCWGCDTCQELCPHNQRLKTTAIEDFINNRILNLSLDDIEALSNREFKQKYGDYAFSWRGKSVLIRNLKIFSRLGELRNEQE